jgi:dihydrofolate synthase/folylpolyglutamate synthase
LSETALNAWLRKIEAMHPASIELGLDRVKHVAGLLGLGKPASCVISVAGTNGKGSTVAFVESIARAAGLRVGAYTSPHILAFNERIRIDGQDVDDATLVRAFERIDAARQETALTYFEFTTLAALCGFEDATLDLAVLEVGLGGRLDAVNLVDADVAILTTVDIDHTDWLGTDREAIGAEKIGIARAGKPVVIGDDDPPSSVLRRAYTLGASAIRINCDFFFGRNTASTWLWRSLGGERELPMPRLTAPVQLRNAAMAVAALEATTLSIPERAYAEGVASAHVAGRLQYRQVDGIPLYIDVAHNAQASAALAQWLAANPITGSTRGVLAMLADKDAAAVFEALDAEIAQWYLAGLGGARGQTAESLAAKGKRDASDYRTHETVAQALDAAIAASSSADRIIVLGSFHTVAEAFTHLAKREGEGARSGV